MVLADELAPATWQEHPRIAVTTVTGGGGAGFRGSGSAGASGSGTALKIPKSKTEDGERDSQRPEIKAEIKAH